MSSPPPTLHELESLGHIRSRPCPSCYLCGAPGVLVYERLEDRLFGAPGAWNFKRCPNPGCGLLWLDPMPLEEDIAKAYRSYYTHQKDAPRPDNVARQVYRTIKSGYLASKYQYRCKGDSRWARILGSLIYLNPVLRSSFDSSVFYLLSKPAGRLLEVGCGSGATLEALERLGWQVEGVDFDAVAVECARRRGLRVHVGTLLEQKLRADSFDVVASSHVIEHVPDPISLLRECLRILKPGGHLVAITPNAGSWSHRIYGADWRGLEPPRHLHIFTLSSLAGVCVRAGFTACNCRSIVRASHVTLASRMLRRTGKADLRSPSFALRLWAEATNLGQWARLLVDHQAGEEIVLTCAKRGQG